MQWEDNNWNAKQICIKRSLWNGSFQTPKSKKSVRKLDVPASLISELKKWKLACPISESDLVFPDKAGQPTPHERYTEAFYSRPQESGTAASKFPLPAAYECLYKDSIRTEYKIYSKLSWAIRLLT